MQFNQETTIAAIATGNSTGALGVVRLSGEKASEIADKVFRGKKTLSSMSGYEAAYGHAYASDGRKLDEVVVLKFVGPKSYTGEDSVEFFCHGGSGCLQGVLQALLDSGAHPAGRGEFTRRALMNGKLTLTQAEAIGEMIAAQSVQASSLALAQREGRLYQTLSRIADELTDVSAHLAALIDFPEEDVPMMDTDSLAARLEEPLLRLEKLVDSYETGQVMKNGIRTALLGVPNAGKSSLMNHLCGRERSIVTPIAGTTRDLVEEKVMLGDIPLLLVDTAGLTETDDPVESLGVGLAEKKLAESQLVLLVAEDEEHLPDEKWLTLIEEKPTLLLCNKSDLRSGPVSSALTDRFPHYLEVSAKTGAGLEKLSDLIAEVTRLYDLDPDQAMLLNLRQKDHAQAALASLRQTKSLLAVEGNFDLAGVMLGEALYELFALSGKTADEEIIDRVFSNFCVGK